MSAAPEIVVTGRGVVSSIGEGAEPFFDALLAKKSGIADGIGACTEFDVVAFDQAVSGDHSSDACRNFSRRFQ